MIIQTTIQSAIEQIRRLLSYEIEIEVNTVPSEDPRFEIEIQAELSDYVFSYRFNRYFHVDDLEVLASDGPAEYALHVPSGLVLCSASCVRAKVWGN